MLNSARLSNNEAICFQEIANKSTKEKLSSKKYFIFEDFFKKKL
jgi:hypothetical protein